MRNAFGRKSLLVLVTFLAFCLALTVIGAGARGHAKNQTSKIIYLNPNQERAIKQVDAALQTLKTQYDSMQQQRLALISGYAISLEETANAGLDWGKDFDFVEDNSGHGFCKLTEEEKKKRAVTTAGQ